MMIPTPDFWQRTPPAIFPPILGSFGLGLAWRQAGEVFGIPAILGEVILALVSLLYLAGLTAYLIRLARHPGALGDDFQTMPGRAGLAALSMGAMLLAATLVPYGNVAARVILIGGLVLHLVAAVTVMRVLWPIPWPQRQMTPAWHMTFVGIIVAPIGAVPLGWTGLAEAIFFLSLATAATVWTGNIVAMRRAAVAPPLRPTIAIHLAPVALLGIAASLLGNHVIALFFGVASCVVMLILVIKIRYLTIAGFSPLWGAFTFPAATFAGLMLALAPVYGGVFWVLAGVGLVAASVVVPTITCRIIKMWIAGSLVPAAKAGAS